MPKFEKTATEMRMNLRHERTKPLEHMILQIIRPHIRDDEEGRYWKREKEIFDLLHAQLATIGAEIVTDYTREEAGLPPRGPDGWTCEELVALEKRRIELLTRPLRAVFPACVDEPGSRQSPAPAH